MTRRYKMPRAHYGFDEIFPMVGAQARMAFHDRYGAICARSAAHVYAHVNGLTFRTKLRETDAGLFELTITRVE